MDEQQHRPLAGGSIDDPIAVDGDRTRLDQHPMRFARVHDVIIANE
jgi:hypothetical protein